MQEESAYENISPAFYKFFQNIKTYTEKAAYFVLIGRPKELLNLLAKDINILFAPTPIAKDAARRVFENVSAADLILFLKDDDMLNQVYELAQKLPEDTSEQITQKLQFFYQLETRFDGHGGADLVMVYDDEPPVYETIKANRHYNFQVYTNMLANEIWDTEKTVLKNPDGIVCWKRSDGQMLWYYANPLTQKLESITIENNLSETDQEEFDAFSKSMLKMPSYAARRSSNQECSLVTRIMFDSKTGEPIKLVRRGIKYNQDGIDYIDTHHDFNRLLNAYLEAIILFYTNFHNNQQQPKDAAYLILQEKLGPMQKEAMWIIQRICQRHLSFRSLPLNYKDIPFERNTEVRDFLQTQKIIKLFNTKTGEFLPYFADGSVEWPNKYSFIFKGDPLHTGYANLGSGSGLALVFEFISLNTIINDSIKGIDAIYKKVQDEIQYLETFNEAMELSISGMRQLPI